MNKVEVNEIERFLKDVNELFPVPISKKVNLEEYAIKLSEKATLCCEMSDNRIISMIAGYTENLTNEEAFIALVACLKEYQHRGLTKKNMDSFVFKCKGKNIKRIHLYTVETNTEAISFYRSYGFVKYQVVNEPRPQDLHLVLYL